MREVIYEHHAVSLRLVWTSVAVWVALVVLVVALRLAGVDAVDTPVLIVGPIVVAVLWIVMLIGMDRLGRIRLTAEQLVVGRYGSVPVADLDPGWVRLQASQATEALRRRVESTPGPVALDTGTGGADADVLGGPFSKASGFEVLTLRLRDRSLVNVATNDRIGLLDGLLTALDR